MYNVKGLASKVSIPYSYSSLPHRSHKLLAHCIGSLLNCRQQWLCSLQHKSANLVWSKLVNTFLLLQLHCYWWRWFFLWRCFHFDRWGAVVEMIQMLTLQNCKTFQFWLLHLRASERSSLIFKRRCWRLTLEQNTNTNTNTGMMTIVNLTCIKTARGHLQTCKQFAIAFSVTVYPC